MTELDYSFIYTKYWLEEPGWSTIDLGKHYNVSYQAIRRFMIKERIPRRTPREASNNMYACSHKHEARREARIPMTKEEARMAKRERDKVRWEKNRELLNEKQRIRYKERKAEGK